MFAKKAEGLGSNSRTTEFFTIQFHYWDNFSYFTACKKLLPTLEGFIAQRFLLLTQSLAQFSVLPKIHFDVAEINRWHWLEERGHRLEYVDLVLASGKIVPHKNYRKKFQLSKFSNHFLHFISSRASEIWIKERYLPFWRDIKHLLCSLDFKRKWVDGLKRSSQGKKKKFAKGRNRKKDKEE